jgi:protein-L-isoaspartate(D-aspartate) O-methyltransferase
MLAPKMEARMIQELDVRKTDKILEVGTGSGYVTALLAKLGGQVISVERVPEFSHAGHAQAGRPWAAKRAAA